MEVFSSENFQGEGFLKNLSLKLLLRKDFRMMRLTVNE